MQIAVYHNLGSGGGKRAVYEWIRRLSRVHDVDAYSLSSADHDFCDIRPYVKNHFCYPFSVRRNFQKPFGRLNQLQRWLDLVDLSQVNRNIASDINRKGYDVVFVNTCVFTFIPELIQYIQIPSLYYLHEPFGKGFIRNIDRPYIKKNSIRRRLDRIDPFLKLYQSRLRKVQQEGVNRISLLLANSQFTSNWIEREFGIATPVCHLGVDLENFHRIEGIQKEDFVLSVGELSPRKGHDFIIRCLGKIPVSDRPSLKIACNTVQKQEADYLQKLADEHNVKLEVLENQTTNDLMFLYNKAKVCVYAPIMEPFGLVPLESMACGVPVMGVDEGGVKESVIHNVTGFLSPRDEAEFAHAIQELLSNPGLADRLGRNGRTHVEKKWTWEKSTSKLENFLSNLVMESNLNE